MANDYNDLARREDYIKRMKAIKAMQMKNPMPYSPEVASSPTPTLQMLYGNNSATDNPILTRTQTPTPTGAGWMDYAGLGAMAAAPVASALIGRQAPRPEFASSSSLGSKPMYEAQSPYGKPQQRIPAFLARLLMGMK